MTTNRRAGRPDPVDLMFGGDEAEALFESWLADDDEVPAPPVRVVGPKRAQPRGADPAAVPLPPDAADGIEPTGWRLPVMRAQPRRPR